jgi:hypothetical protein
VLPASSSWSSLEGAIHTTDWAANAAAQLPRPKVTSLVSQIVQTVIARTLPVVLPKVMPWLYSEDDGACSGFLGCVAHGISWTARGAAHLGYRAAVQAGRCAKYAFSCFEDFERTVVMTSVFAGGAAGGIALGVSTCAATVGLGCGVAATAGAVVTTLSITAGIAYLKKTLETEPRPFDYEHCDPMPPDAWRPFCHE